VQDRRNLLGEVDRLALDRQSVVGQFAFGRALRPGSQYVGTEVYIGQAGARCPASTSLWTCGSSEPSKSSSYLKKMLLFTSIF
jgi:hypothetical protein